MNSARLSMLFGIAGLTGCVSAPLPPEAAAVMLDRRSSEAVAVYQPKLVVKDGLLLLDGWVYRQFGARTTARTHIDVAFLDAAGRELRSEVTDFTPRDVRLRGGRRIVPRGHYTLPIPSLPAGTATIQVRAHDSAEHQP